MRFTTVASALGAAAALAGSAFAEANVDDQKILGNEEDAEPSTPASPQLSVFTPTTIKAEFLEQFTDDWESRWKPSHAKKDMKGQAKEDEEWAYVGEWSVEEPTVFKGMEGDKGLVVKNAAAHHAISAKFPKQIDPTGKTLVVQYEVKLQNGLECGGAYLKLLRENKALHQEEFGNTTPYVIMFGPDKCGHTNKVHFIFNHKNPKTGEYEEKHVSAPSTAKIVKTTELYTLIVKPDNTFSIMQNGIETKSGNLLDDFYPAVNPPAEIDDPEDSKPEDWVDQARIPDPEATKPEDWDEDAPFEIVDEEATMPEDWLENEPLTVPDPEAQKPDDWDDEEDGDWLAPQVPNPSCADVSGCGKWSKPMKKNAEYKGKWSASLIDNPAYKGPWAPRKIANPNYYEDKTPANFEPIGAIGFEIWTMQKDILFDNIYIGHSVEDANKFAEETFKLKHAAEKAAEEAARPKDQPKARSPSDLKFLDDPVVYMREKFDLFVTMAQKDPIEAIRFVPEIAGGLAAAAVTLIAIVASLVAGGSSSPAVKKAATDAKKTVVEAKDQAAAKTKEVKDKVASAAASGSEAVKSEVNKRK